MQNRANTYAPQFHQKVQNRAKSCKIGAKWCKIMQNPCFEKALRTYTDPCCATAIRRFCTHFARFCTLVRRLVRHLFFQHFALLHLLCTYFAPVCTHLYKMGANHFARYFFAPNHFAPVCTYFAPTLHKFVQSWGPHRGVPPPGNPVIWYLSEYFWIISISEIIKKLLVNNN